jgi:hypothetical protein
VGGRVQLKCVSGENREDPHGVPLPLSEANHPIFSHQETYSHRETPWPRSCPGQTHHRASNTRVELQRVDGKRRDLSRWLITPYFLSGQVRSKVRSFQKRLARTLPSHTELLREEGGPEEDEACAGGGER